MDAIKSVAEYPDRSVYEIIIVNDGSTDEDTLKLLASLDKTSCRIFHQENFGPAAARNTGIRKAKADYILFLDSDNKIRPQFIDKSIETLARHPDVGIVYGNARFFGASAVPRFTNGPFDLKKILAGNYIDMCSVMRKKIWEELGGLDENPNLIGHEDWEFWIRAGVAGVGFYHIDEVLFDYRLVSNSLVRSATKPEKYQRMLDYVYQKHLSVLIHGYKGLYNQYTFYQNDMRRPFRTFVKSFCHKYLSKRRTA